MMEVFRILDEMELMVKDSKKVPFSGGKVVLEADVLLDRVDRLRAILPEEMETARLVLSEKQRIIKEACSQADQYLEESRDRVARMIDDNEITKNAIKMSEEIVDRAEEVALEIKRDANLYAEDLLNHVAMVLQKGLEMIEQGKDEIQKDLANDHL